MPKKLSEAAARKGLPPLRGQTMLWDSELKVFALRITPGGAKSFILDYRTQGRQQPITIGGWPDWTVTAAREKAKAMKREVDLGSDLMGERQAQREAPTVMEMWERYTREHLLKKAERSQADERMMWEKIILPRFGNMKVVRITHDDIDALHCDITEIRGTLVRANRTIEVLRKAFNLAIRWKWREDNPASGFRHNQEEKRHRYLNRAEIAVLAQALNERSEPMSANAIKLLMLTGAKRGEVLGATWEMFDLENGVWTKPSSHTKRHKLHGARLSGPAMQLLTEMKAAATVRDEAAGLQTCPYVFPGSTGKPLNEIKRTWASVCRKAALGAKVPLLDAKGKPILDHKGLPKTVFQPNVRIHDIHHSFASILVSAGASLPLIGLMLGHTQVQTTQRYAHLFDDAPRQAAETVGALVLQPSKGQVGCSQSTEAEDARS